MRSTRKFGAILGEQIIGRLAGKCGRYRSENTRQPLSQSRCCHPFAHLQGLVESRAEDVAHVAPLDGELDVSNLLSVQVDILVVPEIREAKLMCTSW